MIAAVRPFVESGCRRRGEGQSGNADERRILRIPG